MMKLHPLWELSEDKSFIQRQIVFSKYMDGVDLTLWLAKQAEELNHHPDITLGYKTMTIRLNTHNLPGLSLADFVMAARIENHLRNTTD